MMFSKRNTYGCPYGCCGERANARKRKSRQTYKHAIRTRERRAWQAEEWS